MEPPTGRILLIIGGFLFLATIFLLVQNAFLSGDLSTTRAELAERSAQLEAANAEIESLSGTLNQTREELSLTRSELENASLELHLTKMDLNETSGELERTRKELRETQSSLREAMEEFLRLREEVVAIEESVNSSIQWFRDNSVLPRSMDWFFFRSSSRCTESRTLRLACIPFLMEKEMGFTYRPEYPDRLLPISEMAERPGGDCEDFSLFLKAYLNRLKLTGASRELEAWDEGGQRYVFYQDKDGTNWYVWGESHYIGQLQELNPYVICFTTRYKPDSFEGHCLVALSGEKVSSVNDMQKLDGAETFEPQNGQYTGRVSERFRVCRNGEVACEQAPGSIVFVIADDDLYQFIGGEWVSYKLYGDKASGLGQRIGEIAGGG